MQRKILFTASTASHIMNFHLPYLKYFKEQGWEVHVAAADIKEIPYADKIYNVPFTKNIFAIENLKAVRRMRSIIEYEQFNIISMHTTLAAFITRIAKISTKVEQTVVINTSHGYLFYKDMNPIRTGMFFLIEYILARFTDDIVTMNEYDYQVSKKYFKCRGNVYKIPGMGVDLSKLDNEYNWNKKEIRDRLSIDRDDFMMVYAAELSSRKNQIFIIEQMPKIIKEYPNIKLFFLGKGTLLEFYRQRVYELGITRNIKFTGQVNNVIEYLTAADLVVSSSKSEGLPFNVMEAMACGKAVLVSRVKGHIDLIQEEENGCLFSLDNGDEFAEKLKMLVGNEKLRERQGQNSKFKVQAYALESVFDRVIDIYRPYL